MGRGLRSLHRLSARAVASAQPGYHADGGGLYLLVAASGSASWVFRYRRLGRLREMGLGSAQVYTLSDARERATVARRQLADGLDPLAEKRSGRAMGIRTWGQAVDDFISTRKSEWKTEAQELQWQQSLAAYGPDRALPLTAINTDLVLSCLRSIWTDKTETATRVRGRIERIWSAEKVKGEVSGENPARWRGHLDALLPRPSKVSKVRHHPAMPYAEVPSFWPLLRGRDGIARLALQFTILTAARTQEVTSATWAEFDLDGGFWDRPAKHMKAGVAHTIPLTVAAIDVLKHLPRTRPPFDLSENAMLFLLQKDLGKTGITVHGFRSTFRDWAGETTPHPREVIEHALAHRIRDKSEAAYARGTLIEKRRQLMDDWAAYVTTPKS
jgi:integrase